MTIYQIFDQQIRPLPEPDRLQMATLILNSLAPPVPVDYNTEWSEEDMRDFTAQSWCQINARLSEEEDAPTG